MISNNQQYNLLNSTHKNFSLLKRCNKSNGLFYSNKKTEPKEQQKHNIFYELPNENELNYIKGPKISSKGDLVKYTLVGKPEWFFKQQKQIGDDNQKNIKLSSTFKLQEDAKEQNVIKFDAISYNNKSNYNKKFKPSQIIRTQGQLIEEMNQIKEKVQLNTIKDEMDLGHLELMMQLAQTRNNRTLNKYAQYQKLWKQFSEKISLKLNREKKQWKSQYNFAEVYRKRVECAQTLELMKSDADYFGPRLWEMSLRNKDDLSNRTREFKFKSVDKPVVLETEQPIPLIRTVDIPEAFTVYSAGRLKSECEFIKFNNNLAQVPSTPSKSRISPYSTFKSADYLSGKLQEIENIFFNTRYMELPNEVEPLSVEGKNQFKLEEQTLTDKPKNFIFRKFKFPEEQIKTSNPVDEQIIAEHYTAKNQVYYSPPQKKNLFSKQSKRITGTSSNNFNKLSQNNSVNMSFETNELRQNKIAQSQRKLV